MNRFIMILGFSIAIVSLTLGFVPAKYLYVDIDVQELNRVEIPGAERIEYYDIQGTDNEMLMRAMQKKRDAIGGYAVTYHSVQYIVWGAAPGNPECKIDKFEVPYTVWVLLPRWNNPEDSTLGMIWIWKNYLPQIAAHEARHVQILLEGVESIKGAIAGSTCENVKERAEAAAQELERLEEEFDILTGNFSPTPTLKPAIAKE